QVLDRAALAGPAAPMPARRPLADPLHQVLRVGDDQRAHPVALLAEQGECGDCAGERHLVVGRRGRMAAEIAAADAPRGAHLDQAASPTGIVTGLAVAEARFIEMNHGHRQCLAAQLSSTWKCSSSSSTNNISSPVIARYALSASRPRCVVSDDATTTYSLPRRRSATRLRRSTACSSCSIRDGVQRKEVIPVK